MIYYMAPAAMWSFGPVGKMLPAGPGTGGPQPIAGDLEIALLNPHLNGYMKGWISCGS